ncbi:MAG: hypothetical protein V9F01_08915 [Chitinophagaceae bacterium]
MRKIIVPVILAITLSSCFKIYEGVSDLLTKDKNCWIDTRSMTLYYDGREKMTGLSIWIGEKDSAIRYESVPGQKGIEKVELAALKDSLINNSVSIWIYRDSVHWRDHISFDIQPGDWKRKRTIVSNHRYH